MNIDETDELSMVPHADLETWNKIFEINLTGTLIGIQTCARLMKKSGGGAIINIGSVAGLTGSFSSAYSSSKWGLEGLSRSAAYIFADWEIRCNVIQSGLIESDTTQGVEANPRAKKAINDSILLRRKGKVEEIAYTALFLASDDSSYITGTDIVVDGGWSTAAPYLMNERQSQLLETLQKTVGS